MYSFGDCPCRVETERIVEIGGKALLGLFHYLSGALGSRYRIRPGQLVDGDIGGRFAVQPAPDVINLRPQINAGHVFQADNRSVRVGPDNDLAEFLLGDEAALGANRISKFLPRRDRLSADLPGRIDRILLLDGIDDLRDGDAEFCQGIGLDPDAYGSTGLPRRSKPWRRRGRAATGR